MIKPFLLALGLFVLALTMGGCAQMQMTCFDKHRLTKKKVVSFVVEEDLHEMCVLERL